MFLASLLGGGGDDGESDVAVEGEEPIYAGGGAVPHEGALRGAASHERVLAEKGSILSERKDAAYALRDVLLEASKSCAKGVFIDLRGSFSALDDEDLDVEMVQALLEGIAAAVAASPETADAVLASGRNCVALLLRLMEGEEMWVRLGAMEVLSNLLDARLGDTMKGILASPAGLQGIVDVLDDSREEVRNETILLLLILADHQEGKSYFAFAVMDRVLEIVLSEGEGAVQDDCLALLKRIVEGNALAKRMLVQGGTCLGQVPALLAPGAGKGSSRVIMTLELLWELLSGPFVAEDSVLVAEAVDAASPLAEADAKALKEAQNAVASSPGVLNAIEAMALAKKGSIPLRELPLKGKPRMILLANASVRPSWC